MRQSLRQTRVLHLHIPAKISILVVAYMGVVATTACLCVTC